MTKHKHYDVIVAWANGEKVQYKESDRGTWCDLSNPTWDGDGEYRVKMSESDYPETTLTLDSLCTTYSDCESGRHAESLRCVANAAIKQYIKDTTK